MDVIGMRGITRFTAAVAAVLVIHGCGDAPPAEDAAAEGAAAAAEMAAGSEAADLEALRQLTSGFTDLAAAQEAGFSERITPCWYHNAQGGQGYHYANTSRLDATVSPLEPEVVMYEPTADGSEQFVAVEYIVPFAAWESEEPPMALGRPMMRNEQLELWVLHVWLGKDNPNGLYENWNPNVSCEHAEESEDRA